VLQGRARSSQGKPCHSARNAVGGFRQRSRVDKPVDLWLSWNTTTSGKGVTTLEMFLDEARRTHKPALGLWCTLSHTLVAEAMAAAGPDYVCIDMQHATNSATDLVSMMQAVAAGGSTPIVRVPDLHPASIMLALDSGARGVIVPMVETAEQAAAAVAACRYPPYGSRSFGPFRASMRAGTNDPRELEKVACIVMIETRRGIDNAEEIVSTEGLTGVYLGPSDLSIALGLPPGSIDHPAFVAARERIMALCRAHDVAACMHAYSGKAAKQAVEQGFDMVTVSADLAPLRQLLASELEVARSAGAVQRS
jgi:4-hydroxy-2-oxoheptanedioate aldolase